MKSSLVAVLFLAIVGVPVFAQKSGVDLKAIDKTADPCQNFYQYACGNWMKANPIPAQFSRWGRFDELQNHNLEILRDIAQNSERHEDRSANDQKIGALYGSCMNEAEVDKAGYKPIEDQIKQIRAMTTKPDLVAEVARLHREQVDVFFRFNSSPDPQKSTEDIASVDQGGLGLRERGFYFRTDAKSEETRKKYVDHVTRMAELLGDSQEDAAKKANAIMALETALAKVSLDNVQRRNPKLLLHEMTTAELQALAPEFNFQQYFAATAAPSFTNLNVRVPDFIKGFNEAINSTSLDDLKAYLIWHLESSYASELSAPFVKEDFDFYNHYLNGAQELENRWRRCIQLTDHNLGEALGQKYVDEVFGNQAKEKTRELVKTIEDEMEADIKSLTWMSDATKQEALAKLRGVTNKIGYPERWRDYSSVKIAEGDLVGDVHRCREFEAAREWNKIGKPVDRAEFGMTPPTVNAYYNPLENNINFPAGILQPPFYDNNADMAVNLGGIGAVIGHELTHGFDDQGRQYDANGNLRDWWTPSDASEFKQRADCIADEYSKFSPIPGANINGRLTLGENGADNGGLRLAYMALLGAMQKGTVDKDKLDGYTPQQRFFLGYAQIWCANQRPESLRYTVQTNPHSPGEFRVVGVVQNMPEFAEAFGCSAGQPMVAAQGCRVW